MAAPQNMRKRRLMKQVINHHLSEDLLRIKIQKTLIFKLKILD